ncbi:Circadian clock protein kinase KaiC [uncultured archaeon]|nr:Circadian clock protein kinase KaiC [uncultured archaeon]
MKRVHSGIPGLDPLIDGGIPAGHSVLVTGSCGTGKTIFGLQFLKAGAESGEPGVYITFEESRDKIISQAKAFGWDFEALERKGMLTLYIADNADVSEILAEVESLVKKKGVQRFVLDSLTTMVEHGVIYRSKISKEMSRLDREGEARSFPVAGGEVTRKDIYYIVGRINELGVTSLLISEVGEETPFLSRDTISEFAADGVIFLRNEMGGGFERLLSVRKMRGTKIDTKRCPFEFTPQGLKVVSEE